MRRSLKESETTLRSVSYSAARESAWEDEIGSMQRLDIKPDAYSESQSMALYAEDEDVEVELEVKRARGGSDGQQQTTSLILQRKRRWLRPAERSALLAHYADAPQSSLRPPLPHQLVVTRSRPAVSCVCQSDGEWQPERMLYPVRKPHDSRCLPLRLPHADLRLEKDSWSVGTYQLTAQLHVTNPQRRGTAYYVVLSWITFGSDDEAATGEEEWQKRPMRLSISHSDESTDILQDVTTERLAVKYQHLTMHVHSPRAAHAAKFSSIHIQIDTPNRPSWTLILTPTVVRGVEYSGVSGQLSVGERHWSEEGAALYDICGEDDEEEERADEFEQRVEAKRRKVAEKREQLDAAASRKADKASDLTGTKQQPSRADIHKSRVLEEPSRNRFAPINSNLSSTPPLPGPPTVQPSAAVKPPPPPPQPNAARVTSNPVSSFFSSVSSTSNVPPAAAVRPPPPVVPTRRVSEPAVTPLALRPSPPVIPVSIPTPVRPPPRPAPLAPVSLSRWGMASTGDTSDEEVVDTTEAAHTRPEKAANTSTGGAASATLQPARPVVAEPIATLPHTIRAAQRAGEPHPSSSVSSTSTATGSSGGSVSECDKHVHMDESLIPSKPGKFDPRLCHKCGRYRPPPPNGWRGRGRPRRVTTPVTVTPHIATAVASTTMSAAPAPTIGLRAAARYHYSDDRH